MQKFYKGEFDGQDKLNQNFEELYQNIKTYSELKVMVTNNLLVAGTQYLLSDYKTKYQQPDTLVIKEMSVERLVLTATSNKTFANICSSLDYPQDVVYYDFNANVCEDGTTPRTGFILRRRDETTGVNIDAPLDWRTMKFVRYLPDPNVYLVGSTPTNYATWTTGNAQIGVIYKYGNALLMAKNINVPTSANDTNVFATLCSDITKGLLLTDRVVGHNGSSNISLKRSDSFVEYPVFGDGCKNIKIASGVSTSKYLCNNIFFSNCINIFFENNCVTNTFGEGCTCISFSVLCSGNILGNNCAHSSFKSHCCNNYISENSARISLGEDCQFNAIGAGGSNISLDTGCSSNIFGAGCGNNELGVACSDNIFSANCVNNSLGSGGYNNIFGYSFLRNTMGTSCAGNVFGSNCWNNTIGSECVGNVFGNGCGTNLICSSVIGNSFGNNKGHLMIKFLQNKNISAVSALEGRGDSTTIERRFDGVFVYWYINTSNVPVYTLIP